MSQRVLVLGINPFDSGKTEVSIDLVEALQAVGHRVEYFKPASGSNYWYKYDHIKKCMKAGQLVSYDAARVRERLRSRVSPLVTNPVHTLFVPSRLERPGRIHPNSLGLAGWDSFLTLQRFSQPNGNVVQSTFLVAERLIDDGIVMISRNEIQALTRYSRTIPITSMEQAQELEKSLYENAVERSFEVIERNAHFVIIESFNNSAWPWERLDYVDHVLVVGPGQVFVYDPEKFRTAVEFAKGRGRSVREVTLARVADLLSPRTRIELIPGQGLKTDDVYQVIDDVGERMISGKHLDARTDAGRSMV